MARTIGWVANAKAICIFLVVLGHFSGLPSVVKLLIYSFHLPAFLVITGYLTCGNLRRASLSGLLRGSIYYYVALYALFTIGASVIWYVLEARNLPITEIIKPLAGGLKGLHGPDLKLVHNDDPLWYFPFLVSAVFLAYLLLNLPWVFKLIVIVMLVLGYSLEFNHPMAWSLDLAPLGALFILLGAGLRLLEDEESSMLQYLDQPRYLVGLLGLWVGLAWINGPININSRIWGSSWLLFVSASILGTGFLIALCKKITPSSIASALSKHTLVIFCTHIYLVKALNKPMAQLPEGVRPWGMLAAAVLVTGACWCISIVVQPWLTRCLKPASSGNGVLKNTN